METLKAIHERHSIRKFKDEQISNEQLETILKAAMAAPSAKDHRPWEFYVIKNKELQGKVKEGITFGKYDAPILLIVAINDKKALPSIMHDTSYCDINAAIENILLAVTDLGLGAVWCAIYPNPMNASRIQKTLELDEDIHPFSAIFIGHPSEDDMGRIKDKYDPNCIHIYE